MAAPTHASTSPDTTRPRLWVPTVAYETLRGCAVLGRRAGVSELAEGLGPLGAVLSVGLAECRHVVWVVERRTITKAHVADHGIVLPESLVDPSELPSVHRWLEREPLLAISGIGWQRLVEAGVPVAELDFGAREEGVVVLRVVVSTDRESLLRLPLGALDEAVREASATRASGDVAADPSPLDRALRLLGSQLRTKDDGSWSESSVASALAVRAVIEDGYGYRGKPSGSFTDLGAVERAFGGLEATIDAVTDRAERQRELARRLRAAVEQASEDTEWLEIVGLGPVRSVHVPCALVSLEAAAGSFVGGGAPQARLELPVLTRWQLPPHDGWRPPRPAALEAGRSGSSPGAARTTGILVIGGLVLLALAVVAGVLLAGR